MITEFWCAANRGGSLMVFTEHPKRNEKLGIWEGKIYINSWVYNSILEQLQESGFSWIYEPQYLQIQKTTFSSTSANINMDEDDPDNND